MEALVIFLTFLALLFISLLCALFISFLYVKFYKSRATGSQVHRTFPLLGISVTAIFICIQFSLPLSLGLLGALSIVRFRTPIKEPEEIGFIMLVVATSLCCATFNILFLGVILTVAVAALLSMQLGRGLLKGGMNDGMLIVTLPTRDYRLKKKKLFETLQKQIACGRVDSISEDEEETVISYSFMKLQQKDMLQLQGALISVTKQVRSNLFFNRSGEI